MLGDLKYAIRRARVVPRLLGRAVREAYRWDDYDERDEQWYPQGISTSADSSDTEAFLDRSGGGRKVLVTTWYSTGKDGIKRGSRVTFVDLDSGEYRHVLLVSPVFDKAGHLTLKPMSIHAGGIVWAGSYLHIAATSRGFVTARVDDIMRVTGATTTRRSSASGATQLHSYGHRYVLPVRFTSGLHRRGPREAAVLLHVARPALATARADRRRVRPRPATPPPGWPATRCDPQEPGSRSAAGTTGSPDRSRSTRAGCARCRAP